MDFATPVRSVSIFVLDFDSIARQVLYIIALDASDNEINRGTITSLGFPGGDGAIQELSVSAPGIYSVQIDSDTINDNGIGFDDLELPILTIHGKNRDVDFSSIPSRRRLHWDFQPRHSNYRSNRRTHCCLDAHAGNGRAGGDGPTDSYISNSDCNCATHSYWYTGPYRHPVDPSHYSPSYGDLIHPLPLRLLPHQHPQQQLLPRPIRRPLRPRRPRRRKFLRRLANSKHKPLFL